MTILTIKLAIFTIKPLFVIKSIDYLLYMVYAGYYGNK